MKWSFFILSILFTSTAISAPVYRIGIGSKPGNLSPFFSFSATSQNILRLAHRSLISFDRNQKPICDLCESFQESSTGGEYTIRFTLKKGIQFSDGTEFTADTVLKSHGYYLSEVIKTPFRFAFGKIKKIDKIDPYQVILHYSEFSISHLPDLFLLKMVKIDGFENLENKDEAEIKGLGNYTIESESPLQVKLKGKKYNLLFQVVQDQTTMAMKAMNNELDFILESLSPRKVEYLRSKVGEKFSFKSVVGSNLVYIAPNFENPLLSNQNFRRALAYLMPIKSYIKYKLKGTSAFATGFFAPAFLDFYEKEPLFQHSIELASKELRKVEGIEKKKDHYLYDGNPINLKLVITNSKNNREFAQSIKPYFQKMGIGLEIRSMEWGSYKKARERGDFDLILGSWVGFKTPDIMEFALASYKIPPKGGNRGRFESKLFDNHIQSAVSNPSKGERKSDFIAAHRISRNENAYFFLWHPNIIWIHKSCLEVPKLYSNGSFEPLREIHSRCK